MGTTTRRFAVVTGGSRGIGRAVVQRLAADGYGVVFGYRADEAAAESSVEDAVTAGGLALAQRADVADEAQLIGLFEAADGFVAQHGGHGLDAVVNNAGIFDATPIAEATLARFGELMATNAGSVLIGIQQAARRMPSGGRIVNVSTIGTLWPSTGEALYAASKAAVEQLTRVASREFGSRGITVNCVLAGPTDTDMLRSTSPPEALDGVAGITALGRIGTPIDIAAIVAMLAGDDGGWLTGQLIRADGGLT